VGILARHITARVAEMIGSFRVVVLGGARQTGKTTLVRSLLDLPEGARFTFDDEATLRRAIEDPVGFVEVLPRSAAVDEFQRAGRGFLLAVKQRVDLHRDRGQLLLTGSANYLADRSVAETLAGRVGRLELWPLSLGGAMTPPRMTEPGTDHGRSATSVTVRVRASVVYVSR